MIETYTIGEVRTAINAACDDILTATGNAAVDALNLLVNATIYYLEHPDDRTLENVVADSYEASLAEVLHWIKGL